MLKVPKLKYNTEVRSTSSLFHEHIVYFFDTADKSNQFLNVLFFVVYMLNNLDRKI